MEDRQGNPASDDDTYVEPPDVQVEFVIWEKDGDRTFRKVFATTGMDAPKFLRSVFRERPGEVWRDWLHDWHHRRRD